MTIIIAGDSYSAYKENNSICWVSQIAANTKIVSVAGYSNWDIMKALKEFEPQPAIISLTHLKRLPYELTIRDGKHSESHATHGRAVELNTKAAYHIVQKWKDAYVWSSFPHYESWPGVHFIPLYEENEMWVGDVGEFTENSGYVNHLTEKGNCDLADHMNTWIRETLR